MSNTAIRDAILTAFVFTIFMLLYDWTPALWDARVYINAVSNDLAGRNPYEIKRDLIFVYHPLVLRFFRALDGVFSFRGALFLAYSLIIIIGWKIIARGMSLLSCRDFRKDISSWGIFALNIMGIGGFGVGALMTGNITTYLHIVIISSLFLAMERRKFFYLFFCAAVVFSSIIKPYLLSYLLFLIILLGGKEASRAAAASIALFLILWFQSLIFDPHTYNAFMSALMEQTIGRKDLGFGSSYMISRFAPSGNTITAGIVLWSVTLLSMSYIIIRLSDFLADSADSVRIATLLFAVILLNPRLSHYDSAFLAIPVSLMMAPHGFLLQLGSTTSVIAAGQLKEYGNDSHAWNVFLYALYFSAAMISMFIVSHWNSGASKPVTHAD
jgi:hypothetical protein